jgi:hypothetical protein
MICIILKLCVLWKKVCHVALAFCGAAWVELLAVILGLVLARKEICEGSLG